jgi:murein DD-endopeptidase MepM/ murein hydrolase activator NlpD
VLVFGGCGASFEEAPRSRIVELTSKISVTDGRMGPGADKREAFSWPVEGVVSSPFGARAGKRHDGIDIAVPEGTPVRAAADGVVVYAGARVAGYGNLVLVRHDGDLVTVYAHNRLLEVREGDRVSRGQEIARSGQTGRATAPHLHFEVRRSQAPTNPLEYLPPHREETVHGRSHPYPRLARP